MRAERNPSPQQPSSEEIALLSSVFNSKLREEDLWALLRHLNGMAGHRFTGIYRFEPGWVVSVVLFDRENPSTRVGADVKMKESYCWLTGIGDKPLVIEDATLDVRLRGHAAQHEVRSYVAILLRDASGAPRGTLCNFDFEPRAVTPGILAQLERYRPLAEEVLVRDQRAQWDPDAPSEQRAVRLES
jgi:hypothetical protein